MQSEIVTKAISGSYSPEIDKLIQDKIIFSRIDRNSFCYRNELFICSTPKKVVIIIVVVRL